MAKDFKYRQNSKKFIAGGCSFTLGNELSDDVDGKTPSKNSWAYLLYSIRPDDEYVWVVFTACPTEIAPGT